MGKSPGTELIKRGFAALVRSEKIVKSVTQYRLGMKKGHRQTNHVAEIIEIMPVTYDLKCHISKKGKNLGELIIPRCRWQSEFTRSLDG